MSVLTIPETQSSSGKLFVKMWSIIVALPLEIENLVGLLIKGKNL